MNALFKSSGGKKVEHSSFGIDERKQDHLYNAEKIQNQNLM